MSLGHQASSSVENVSRDGTTFSLLVRSNNRSFWSLCRTYDDFRFLDKWLHKCCFSRHSSGLKQLPAFCPKSEKSAITLLDCYLRRFSTLFGSRINCCCILNWLQMDNRGNKLLVGVDDSPINIPAKAAASAIRDYRSRAIDELSFEAGSMISVIDMPPATESCWWRGKRLCAQKGRVEVGFFPSQYVRLIGHRQASDDYNLIENGQEAGTVRAKHSKVITFLRSFFSHRPSRIALKQVGIVKERAFGCDLGEHLHTLGQDVPYVLRICAKFIESHGIVDGIYRLNGSFTNIQKLRQMFDEMPRVTIDTDTFSSDVHAVSSVVKMYFRELPIPILTFDLFDRFMDIGKCGICFGDVQKISQIAGIIGDLPPPNYKTLRYLIIHLKRMAEHSKQTNMNARNLAIVWAPNLLKTPRLKPNLTTSQTNESELKFVQIVACITEYLILHCDQIFDSISDDPSICSDPLPCDAQAPKRSILVTQSQPMNPFNQMSKISRLYLLNSSIANKTDLDGVLMNCDRLCSQINDTINSRHQSIRIDPPVMSQKSLLLPCCQAIDNLSDCDDRKRSDEGDYWDSEDEATTPTFAPVSPTTTSGESKSVYTLPRNESASGSSLFKELDAFIDTEFDLDGLVEENKIYFNPSAVLSSADVVIRGQSDAVTKQSPLAAWHLNPAGGRPGAKRNFLSLTQLELNGRRGVFDQVNERRQSLPVYLFRCLLSRDETVPMVLMEPALQCCLAKHPRLHNENAMGRRYSAEIKDCCDDNYSNPKYISSINPAPVLSQSVSTFTLDRQPGRPCTVKERVRWLETSVYNDRSNVSNSLRVKCQQVTSTQHNAQCCGSDDGVPRCSFKRGEMKRTSVRELLSRFERGCSETAEEDRRCYHSERWGPPLARPS